MVTVRRLVKIRNHPGVCVRRFVGDDDDDPRVIGAPSLLFLLIVNSQRQRTPGTTASMKKDVLHVLQLTKDSCIHIHNSLISQAVKILYQIIVRGREGLAQ